jgi:protein phosphatase
VTDVGRTRKHNEDCLLIKGDLDLFCVADGMGGHNAGDVASKLVTTSLGNYFEATVHGPAQFELPDDYASLPPGARRLAAGVAKANRDVHTISNTHQQHHGMGSTCVAIHLADGMAHIAHVGDSRCYRIRDGEIKQMTRDHSLINDALDMKPDLTKEELARLPKNIITRALGMKDAVKVDVKSEIALPGDIYLLCSDGLTGMVPVDQILDVINLTPEPQEACELLVAEANDHGGTDNISALLVRVDDPEADADAEVLDEVDISAHAELDQEALDISAHAELDQEALDISAHAELEEAELQADASFDVEAPPSAERITYPSAPAALRSTPPVSSGEIPKPPPQALGLGETARAPAQPVSATEAPTSSPRALAPTPAHAEPPPHALAATPAFAEPAPLPPTSKPLFPELGDFRPHGRTARPTVREPAVGRPFIEPTAPAPASALREIPASSEPPPAAIARTPLFEIVGPPHEDGGGDHEPVVDRAAGLQAPDLEVGEDANALDDLTPEEAAALAEGGEIDLDLRGPWPAKPVVKRCPLCRFELFPGNRFCVECGARVEAPASGLSGEP